MFKKIVVIENSWDCPHFVDGYHKVNIKLPRFGCKLTGKKCADYACPLPDAIDEQQLKELKK